jgi:putative ATP-dependent endonuclease of the OLD family
LVEGLAELILLPTIARLLLKQQGRSATLFGGATVVAVGGVDFEPYVRLLLTKHDGTAICDQLVVVTDTDPNPIDGEVAVNRPAALNALAEKLDADSALQVFASSYTFEADLASIKENLPVLKKQYLKQHKLSEAKWLEIENSADPAKSFHQKLSADKSFISKGEFAQDLAASISTGEEFKCPQYIEQAIQISLPPLGDVEGAGGEEAAVEIPD